MEILGSTFDDSVFLEVRDRVCESLSSYNAKVCEPEWFCDSNALVCTEDSLDKQKVFKFRGDLALRQGNYQKAVEAYSSCLQWISDNNWSIKRDVVEGMARCWTKLGQRHKAIDLVDVLSKEASNTCHLTSLLLLKISIFQHFGAVESQMFCLEHLCSVLPFTPWHWFNLGQVCLQLLDRNTNAAEPVDRKTKEHREEAAELDEDSLRLKASVCFIRTRLLLRLLRQQQSSFVLKRADYVLQQTEQLLEQLKPDETTLQTLTEVMSEDLIPDKMREDYQDGESLTSVCLQSFKERWWSKILLTGLLKNNTESVSEHVADDWKT